MALCKAAPLLRTTESAEKLVAQLSPYILEAHSQAFVPSPFLREIEPSPLEALSYNLTTALLSLGVNHESVQEVVAEKLWTYLDCCLEAIQIATNHFGRGSASEVEDAIHVATIALSLLGFMNAASSFMQFWGSSERLDLIEHSKKLLSEDFLIAVETAFSTIRNAHSQHSSVKEWKRYVRHYAAIGRPLGAMLLQRSFMWLLVAGTSLLICRVDELRGNDVQDLLMSDIRLTKPDSPRTGESHFQTIELMADLAAEEMSLLEDGADYLRLGSAWQQRVAFSVKAAALISFANCALLNEDAADPDVLMTWLEDTLADPVQMADQTLATVVLRSMALVSRLSPAVAPNVSRLLSRFIVQGAPRGQITSIASTSLAFVLQNLSQDAVISTLYTLGNVLSSGTTSEKALASGTNGDLSMDGNTTSAFYTGKQSTGSSISLAISGEEETSLVYGNVVQAICGIASSCNDAKITALAQSMLLQKVDRVSKSVDALIVPEAAVLALSGGPLEFRSLLKLYNKLSCDGVVENNDILLAAVSQAFGFLSL